MDMMDPATAPSLLTSAPDDLDLDFLSNGILLPQCTGPWYADNPMSETQTSSSDSRDSLGSKSAMSFGNIPVWFPEFSIRQQDETLFLGHQSAQDQSQTDQRAEEPSQDVPLEAAANPEGPPRGDTNSHSSISLSDEMVQYLYEDWAVFIHSLS